MLCRIHSAVLKLDGAELESGKAAIVDTAAATESDRPGDALVKLEADGIAHENLVLTVAIHGRLSEPESLDGDIRRIFASDLSTAKNGRR